MRRAARLVLRGIAPRRAISFFGRAPEDAPRAEELFTRVKVLHETVLAPLNSRFLGPLEKSSEELIPLPMVFILGNHSSGKSSFINYVCGKSVQETGVAPTDDGFTLICNSATADADQDGPALVGDPTLGFSGLRPFGGSLINKLSLKIRTGLAIEEVLLVDSPGMIDSPVSDAGAGSTAADVRTRERGYDFSGVVRWFAERADVVLLFQDPGKPGTTGETLKIMSTSLLGLDYKTHIILNKADQFSTVHDFARAYGALCWNLSKVIPRKDLPRIFTMRVPVAHPDREGGMGGGGGGGSGGGGAPAAASLRDALPDLDAALQEIVGEVRRAPLRRVDNLVTRLYDAARLLRLHAVVLADVQRAYLGDATKAVGGVASLAAASAALAAALMSAGAFELGAPLAAATLLGTAGGTFWAQRYLQQRAAHYIDGPGLDLAFRRTHYLQLAERDEFVAQLWERAHGPLRSALRTVGLRALPTPRRAELAAIDGIIDDAVPALRRAATKVGGSLAGKTAAAAAFATPKAL